MKFADLHIIAITEKWLHSSHHHENALVSSNNAYYLYGREQECFTTF